MNNIQMSILLLIALLIGIIINWFKYTDQPTITFKQRLHATSPFFFGFTTLLLLITIVFSSVYAYSPYNLPPISYNSSELFDLIDVDDGIIVVGRTRATVNDPDSPSSYYGNSRSYIAKYDYDGNMIWDQVFYLIEEFDEFSGFQLVRINGDGNIEATGTFGGYYDGYKLTTVTFSPDGDYISYDVKSYEVYSILPYFLNENDVLYFGFEEIDHDTKTYQVQVVHDEDTSITDTNTIYTITYSHHTITEYNTWEPRISVVYHDDNYLVVGITAFDMRDTLVFNSLYIFDNDINLIQTIALPGDVLPGTIQQMDDRYYMISRNDVNRLSSISILDQSFDVTKTVQIETSRPHFLINDCIIQDDLIYIAGNEYDTPSKVGFVEYFTGVINVYTMDLEIQESTTLRPGVGINEMLLIDDRIYTTGLFNTYIGLDSNYNNYPWCGVFSVVDEENRNYILAFTHTTENIVSNE